MKNSRAKQRPGQLPAPQNRKISRLTVVFLGLVVTGGAMAIAATVVDWPAVSEAELVFAGGAPQPPLFQVKIADGKHFFHVTTRPLFKNTGFRSGSIRRVHVVPVGVEQSAADIKVLHLDTSEIGWLETKEVRCEFMTAIDSAALNRLDRLEFRIYFYGPGDKEVYWEGITVENVDSSSSSADGSRKPYVKTGARSSAFMPALGNAGGHGTARGDLIAAQEAQSQSG
jgi:hypothetical protein